MFPLFIKPTKRGELAPMKFVLEVVDGRFWWTRESSRCLKGKSISLEDQALLFLAKQIKEHSIKHLLSCFLVSLLMVQVYIPTIVFNNAFQWYVFLDFGVVSNLHVFFTCASQLMRITLISFLQKIAIPGLSSVNAVRRKRSSAI